MTLFDGRPAGHKGDPLEDIGTRPEKTDELRMQTPLAFVKRPMREKKGGGPVIFVGVVSGRVASEGEREAGSDPTT